MKAQQQLLILLGATTLATALQFVSKHSMAACSDADIMVGDESGNQLSSIAAGEKFVPYVCYSGTFYPICGHNWWDNDEGATTVCKALGFNSGKKPEAADRGITFATDAMSVGGCEAGEPIDSCTRGGNFWGVLPGQPGYCTKGATVGFKMICDSGSGSTSSSSTSSADAGPSVAACDNSTGTCTISEDPHIEVFDGGQISLIDSSLFVETASVVGDAWLVKSGLVSIQARMANDDTLDERNMFVRAVAIGGDFLKGNTMVIGSLEDQVTWNGKPILQEDEFEMVDGHVGSTSSFSVEEKEFFVKASRSDNSSLVQDLSKTNRGLTIEMPLGLSLVVNRLKHHLNVAIKMPPQEGGQEGLCGNFNGIAGDDSMEMAAKRSSPTVRPEESLFQEGSFE